MPFGLREGLSRPCVVVEPSQSTRLYTGSTPRLNAGSRSLATKSNFEMHSSDEEPTTEEMIPVYVKDKCFIPPGCGAELPYSYWTSPRIGMP